MLFLGLSHLSCLSVLRKSLPPSIEVKKGACGIKINGNQGYPWPYSEFKPRDPILGGGGRKGKKKKRNEILKSRNEFWCEILLFKIYMGTFLNLLKLSLRKGKGDFFFNEKIHLSVCVCLHICVEVRGQLLRASSLFLPHRFQELSSDHQACSKCLCPLSHLINP